MFRYEDLYDSGTIFPEEEKYFGSIQQEDISLLRRRVSLATEIEEQKGTDQALIAHATSIQKKMHDDPEIRNIDGPDEVTPTIIANCSHGVLEEVEIGETEEETEPVIANLAEMQEMKETYDEFRQERRWKVQDDATYISGIGTVKCAFWSALSEDPEVILEEDIISGERNVTLLAN